MDSANLRRGYTTGSAAAAAAYAAYRNRIAGEVLRKVSLALPDGSMLEIPVLEVSENRAVVVKDGGDDPDVTTGAHIVVTLLPHLELDEHEYAQPCGKGTLFIRGGRGVGVVTRGGLNVPVGHYAVNPGPRRMIAENLRLAGFGEFEEELVVCIEVPEGDGIALKTLNPVLGIVGGISILGNSGIVYPYSNAAYAASIVLQLKSIAAEGGECAAIATGGRSALALTRDFPFLKENEIVRIADFIHVSVSAAKNAPLKRLIVGCMPGKLFKYACGEQYTHAHKTKLMLPRLREFAPELPAELPLESMDSMGELATKVDPAFYRKILYACYKKALNVLNGWGGGTMKIEIALYGDQGERLL